MPNFHREWFKIETKYMQIELLVHLSTLPTQNIRIHLYSTFSQRTEDNVARRPLKRSDTNIKNKEMRVKFEFQGEKR